MTNGYWGSRLPVANLLCSRCIFTALQWRIVTRRFSNKLRKLFRRHSVKLSNDEKTRELLLAWVNKGYDKFNIGGGAKNLEGFVNIDFVAHLNVQRELIANILDLSFFPPETASHIHSNHVIEHLNETQLRYQLKEYYRILKAGGILTVRCPNALGVSYAFWFDPILENNREDFIASGFPADESFRSCSDRWLYRDFFGFLHWIYGDMGNIENEHLSIITPSKLKAYVTDAGFTVVRMTAPEAINLALIARKQIVAKTGDPPCRFFMDASICS